MPVSPLTLSLSSPDHTAEAARHLATMLQPGDVVLVNGPVGAGKSHFCRSVIAPLLIEPEDIPSPTFTLVQSYDTRNGTLWHSDLYRVTSTQEIEELGLIDAFQDAICLVEWPDRLGELAPTDALSIKLSNGPDENSRTLCARWKDPKWSDRTKTMAEL